MDTDGAQSDAAAPPAKDLWRRPLKRLRKRFDKRPLTELLVDWQPVKRADRGCALRGGVALAQGKPLTLLQRAVTNLACGVPPGRKLAQAIDWPAAADALLVLIDQSLRGRSLAPELAMEATAWAYALPVLPDYLDLVTWQSLCQSLDALARHCQCEQTDHSVAHLIGGCELPLVLRLRLDDWACDRLVDAGIDGLCQWNDAGQAALSGAVASGRYGRLAVASLLRQRRLIQRLIGGKWKRQQWPTVIELAGWVLALTRRDGTAMLSGLTKSDLRDDRMPGGLLDALQDLAPSRLGPAAQSAIRQAAPSLEQQQPERGAVARAIELPETLWHSESAGLAAMLPEWKIARGRVAIDYRQTDCQIEALMGSRVCLSGRWQAMIDVDGEIQQPAGRWRATSEYSDDEVHYLELSQPWSGGVSLQRQVMLLREECCLLLADAVLRSDTAPTAFIRYSGRVPLATAVAAAPDPELNEVWLGDQRPGRRRRVLALSLQASEWQQPPGRDRFSVTPDHHLNLTTASGRPNDNGGNVLAALWLDFQRHRFDRPRTYRQLTVGDELRIVDPDEAAAHRVQMGSEQWVTYWSLRGKRNRTFLGRHLCADFYCARFHPGDGSMEDLLTVGGWGDEDDG